LAHRMMCHSREIMPARILTRRCEIVTTNSGLKPGSTAPKSGIYQTPAGQQVVSTQGNPLPPGPNGTTYKLVDPAKHKG